MNLAFGLAPVDVAEGPWIPLADLSETDDAYVVEVDLPGVNRDQIGIQLQDRELVITGEIPESEQKGRRHRRSRRTGRFEFRTYLPGDVNADAVDAQLSNGVLTVTIPKSQEAQPRKIEIKGGPPPHGFPPLRPAVQKVPRAAALAGGSDASRSRNRPRYHQL